MLLQFWLFVFGLPPFHMGIWVQTEPTMVALFVFAFCNAAWLGWGISRRYLTCEAVHPIAWCLIAWVGWQIIVTCFASNAWRSWFGAGQNGEGAGWYVALLLQYMVLHPLWRDGVSRSTLMLGAVMSVLLQCLLQAAFGYGPDGLYIPGTWVPAQWGAYLAFMVAPLWIAGVTGGLITARRGYAVLAVLMLALLFISENASAITLFIPALLCSLVMSSHTGVRRCWRVAAMLACLLPLGWIGFSAVYPAFEPAAPHGGISYMLSKKDGPISSRLAYNKVGIAALQHEPSRLLLGDGWGRFTDDLFKYVLIDGVEAFHDGKHQPNWFMVDGQTYHSHNQALEALLSLGIVGMVLWFALPMVALATIPREYFWTCAPLIIAQTALSGLWFELPQCVPYQALLWVVLSAATVSARHVKRLPPALFYSCVSLLMLWSAVQQWEAMRYGDALHDVIASKDYKDYDLEWLERDIARGGERLRVSALGYAVALADRTDIQGKDVDWYEQYLAAAHDASLSPRVGARAASTEVWLQYKLLLDFSSPHFAGLGHEAVQALPQSLTRLAQRAPLRDDIASPYLMNLADATHGNTSRQIEILDGLLKVAPDHRGAMWMLGKVVGAIAGREAEGEALRERALALGATRVYPAR